MFQGTIIKDQCKIEVERILRVISKLEKLLRNLNSDDFTKLKEVSIVSHSRRLYDGFNHDENPQHYLYATIVPQRSDEFAEFGGRTLMSPHTGLLDIYNRVADRYEECTLDGRAENLSIDQLTYILEPYQDLGL